MSKRIANPFPEAKWAQQAYQNAAYMDSTIGCAWDEEKGEITTQPRPWHHSEPITGSPGDILSNNIVIEDIGMVPTERARLNLAFILGYMFADLDNSARESNTNTVTQIPQEVTRVEKE